MIFPSRPFVKERRGRHKALRRLSVRGKSLAYMGEYAGHLVEVALWLTEVVTGREENVTEIP